MVVSQRRDNHARMHADFGWRVPAGFNIAQACSARWAARPRCQRAHRHPRTRRARGIGQADLRRACSERPIA